MKQRIGAHQSTSGGYHKALESINTKGGNCLQIFSSSPFTWSPAQVDKKTTEKFTALKNELKIRPVYFHALYLVNLADPGITGQKSVAALTHELELAARLEVVGSIVHTGSFKNKDKTVSCRDEQYYPTLLKNIKKVLSETPDNTLLILENAGNRKIGQTIDQLAEIVEDVNDPRVRICLDTCHLHAAGYDLVSMEQFESFLDDFEKKIGLNKLEVIHMNDSRDKLNDLRDRHENIGEGFVGRDVFKNFLNHPKTCHIPFIIETPGFDSKGPDKENIDILKSLITQ
ncbi:deoxyribonuclease IV [Candidatus Roizmanbacteria bacterium]|nr:MAG: deoxyribonuclease IV [Candidatus Roizmanbacteria bacterium]